MEQKIPKTLHADTDHWKSECTLIQIGTRDTAVTSFRQSKTTIKMLLDDHFQSEISRIFVDSLLHDIAPVCH